LGPAINTTLAESSPFVTPGDDFLLFILHSCGGDGRGCGSGDAQWGNRQENCGAVMESTMKIFWCLLVCSFAINSESTLADPSFEGKYFSQTPPGMTAKKFAPGIISTIYHEHSSPVYSPDGKEMFYTLSHEHGHALMYLRMENGQWSIPKTALFSGEFSDDKAHFSADGKRLYFSSKRPIDGLTEEENKLRGWVYRDWYIDKINDEWPRTATLNLDGNMTQTLSGTIYGNKLSDIDDPYSNRISYQTLTNGTYSEPVIMSDDINSGRLNYFGFVAPDESYLLFYALGRPEMADDTMSIFISFRSPDGVWGKSISLGEPVNYDGGTSRFPRISPDGKYLFFNWQKDDDNQNRELTLVEKSFVANEPYIGNGDIYWISSEIIEQLRHTNEQ